jgi:hypothetical protein
MLRVDEDPLVHSVPVPFADRLYARALHAAGVADQHQWRSYILADIQILAASNYTTLFLFKITPD